MFSEPISWDNKIRIYLVSVLVLLFFVIEPNHIVANQDQNVIAEKTDKDSAFSEIFYTEKVTKYFYHTKKYIHFINANGNLISPTKNVRDITFNDVNGEFSISKFEVIMTDQDHEYYECFLLSDQYSLFCKFFVYNSYYVD